MILDLDSTRKAINVLDRFFELLELVKSLTDDEYKLVIRSLEKSLEKIK